MSLLRSDLLRQERINQNSNLNRIFGFLRSVTIQATSKNFKVCKLSEWSPKPCKFFSRFCSSNKNGNFS
ncbi:hypothetical protein LEP1GSC036_1046 [Leptospira weilii str. 2006001853]|uniref:Uncharacterized protein n=1 Tax=Leptospira weilii str. 2006001853 TaxID=1001589 RepID=A0A828Z3M6_9LEPT|nr:hypothetical protein LEP1GSC036_1046 [Leptospira weilii str. 2006001853]QDK24711.1 hypothetical protein FHG67_06440 [Leptospira weilii]QDK28663.1 hypothetical protein FHG68_06360 [Leptospira weilii]